MHTLLSFFIGFFSAAICVLLFAVGFLMGRKSGHYPLSSHPVHSKEEERIQDEQAAFHRLQNYSLQDAYNLNIENPKG